MELDPAIDTILPHGSTCYLGSKQPSRRLWGRGHPTINSKTLGLSCSSCPECIF